MTNPTSTATRLWPEPEQATAAPNVAVTEAQTAEAIAAAAAGTAGVAEVEGAAAEAAAEVVAEDAAASAAVDTAAAGTNPLARAPSRVNFRNKAAIRVAAFLYWD